MAVYIALLRGINVSGQKLIKMDRLQRLFEALSFQRVRTYIQSGNVVFEAEEQSTESLSAKLQLQIDQEFGFDVPVIVRTADELEAVLERNPFEEEVKKEAGKLYVTLLADLPPAEAVAALESLQTEVDLFRVIGREVYILCRESYGRSQFSNNFLEKKLKLAATTRNWATMNKLVQMGRG